MNFMQAMHQAEQGHRIYNKADCLPDEDNIPESILYEFNGSGEFVDVSTQTVQPSTCSMVSADWGVVEMYDDANMSEAYTALNQGKYVEMETCTGWEEVDLVNGVLTIVSDTIELAFRIKK